MPPTGELDGFLVRADRLWAKMFHLHVGPSFKFFAFPDASSVVAYELVAEMLARRVIGATLAKKLEPAIRAILAPYEHELRLDPLPTEIISREQYRHVAEFVLACNRQRERVHHEKGWAVLSVDGRKWLVERKARFEESKAVRDLRVRESAK